MLVKKSIVEGWYQRDSWVYKNFSYLFKNPLWSKTIPNGYSVCPYFWLSLFSLFIFKPFIVFPMHRCIQPIINKLGNTALTFDEWSYYTINRSKRAYIPGGGIASLLLLIIIIICNIGLLLITYNTYSYLNLAPEGKFIFFSIFVPILPVWINVVLDLFNKNESRWRLKPFYYTFPFIFVIAGLLTQYTEFIAAIAFVVDSISNIIRFIYDMIAYGLLVSFKSIYTAVSYYLKVTYNTLTNGLFGSPINLLEVLVLGIVFTLGLGFMIDKLNAPHTYTFNPNDHETNKRIWIQSILNIIRKPLYRRIDSIRFYLDNDDSTNTAILVFKNKIAYKAVETFFASYLNTLKSKNPYETPNNSVMFRKNEDASDRLRSLDPIFNNLYYTYSEFDSIIIDIINTDPEIRTYINELETKKQSTPYRVGFVELSLLWIDSYIREMYTKISTIIKKIYTQIKTFFVYIWMLCKAKKQGACPYFRFTDEK